MAEEYDNKNKGAAFPPFPDQEFILSGKLDIDGDEKQCVYIRGETAKGKQIIRIYQEIGIMFKNDSVNENAPVWSGELEQHNKKIAAWKRQSANTPSFLSLAVTDRDETKSIDQSTKPIDDDIPF
jgi:hypothetical protein